MNRDDIIRMAREAGFHKYAPDFPEMFERFAALVAEAEREACAMMADEAVLQLNETANQLEDSEYLERCAIQGAMTQAAKLSKAIRARGDKA